MRRLLIPILLFIVLPWSGLTISMYSTTMQAEYQMPTKQAKQQVQSKQAGLRAQSKPAAQKAQSKQSAQPDQMDNPAQRAQSKQSAKKAESKQNAQKEQKKQPVQQVQSKPSKRPETLQLPAYSDFSKRKRSVQPQPVQQVTMKPASHKAPAYSVYKTSKQSVHHVQGGYMQPALSDVPAHPMRGQRILTTGAVYASTVYVPFDNTPPSMYSEALAMADRGGRRAKQGFLPGMDDDPAQTSPVGEPWVMAIFALLFGGIVALRRRNRGASRVHRGNHVSYHTQ